MYIVAAVQCSHHTFPETLAKSNDNQTDINGQFSMADSNEETNIRWCVIKYYLQISQ